MPAVTRELAIIYGAITMGGASSTYLLTGTYSVRHGYGSLTVECSVVVVATTQAAFRTAYIALEDGIRKPRQDLTITLGGGSQTFTEAANTGLNHEGMCARSIAGTDFDTGLSRLYDVSITCELPADLSGDNGLATKAIDVVTDASERAIVTIDGSYTALALLDARAQYEAQIAALISSTMTALGITNYETIQSDVANDFNDKVCNFRVSMLQILYPETASATNDSRLKNVRLTISRGETAPGDASAKAERPVELTVAYGCDVDSSASTDLEGIFDNTILPYMVTKAREVTSATSIAVVQKSPIYDRSGNGIEATISIMAYAAGALISHQMTVTDEENYPVKLIPVWDGNPHAKMIQPAEGFIVKTIREETIRFQKAIGGGGGGGMGSTFQGNPGYIGGLSLGDPLAGISFGAFGGGGLNIAIDQPKKGPKKGGVQASGDEGTPDSVVPANRANGMFIPVRALSETTPMVQGLPPYQVRLERVLSVQTAVFIVEPESGWKPAKPNDGAGEGQVSKNLGSP